MTRLSSAACKTSGRFWIPAQSPTVGNAPVQRLLIGMPPMQGPLSYAQPELPGSNRRHRGCPGSFDCRGRNHCDPVGFDSSARAKVHQQNRYRSDQRDGRSNGGRKRFTLAHLHSPRRELPAKLDRGSCVIFPLLDKLRVSNFVRGSATAVSSVGHRPGAPYRFPNFAANSERLRVSSILCAIATDAATGVSTRPPAC